MINLLRQHRNIAEPFVFVSFSFSEFHLPLFASFHALFEFQSPFYVNRKIIKLKDLNFFNTFLSALAGATLRKNSSRARFKSEFFIFPVLNV